MSLLVVPIWKSRTKEDGPINCHISLPGSGTSGQLLLMQRLNQLLHQHPQSDHFRLYWDTSDFCSLDYKRSSQTLNFVNGNAQSRCVNITYTRVSPEDIRRVVAKGGNPHMLTQFGCTESSYQVGGMCEITD